MPNIYVKMKSALPLSYVDFIEKHDGWEGDLGDELGYVVLWSKETIQEQYDGYEMATYLADRWFPIGSNGGGEMLCFDLETSGDAVFWIPFIGMSDEEAILLSGAFSDIARLIGENR